MSNINLFESAQEKKGYNMKFSGKALAIPVIVLIITFSVLGAVKVGISYLEKQKNKIEQESQALEASLSGKNVDRVVDFEERMKKSQKIAFSRNDYGNYLDELETLVVSGARVSSLLYSSKEIEIEMVADNFQTIARQALSFKNSKYFKDLEMGDTNRNNEGGIGFLLAK